MSNGLEFGKQTIVIKRFSCYLKSLVFQGLNVSVITHLIAMKKNTANTAVAKLPLSTNIQTNQKSRNKAHITFPISFSLFKFVVIYFHLIEYIKYMRYKKCKNWVPIGVKNG
jgi:hypothetical protein